MTKRSHNFPDPDFGERIKRVGVRLGHESISQRAAAYGILRGTYAAWEIYSRLPGAGDLWRAVAHLRDSRGRPVAQRLETFAYLANGANPPPAWLENKKLDAYAESEDPRELPKLAMPVTLLIERVAPLVREAASNAIRSGGNTELLRVAADYEDFVRSVIEEQASRAASPRNDATSAEAEAAEQRGRRDSNPQPPDRHPPALRFARSFDRRFRIINPDDTEALDLLPIPSARAKVAG